MLETEAWRGAGAAEMERLYGCTIFGVKQALHHTIMGARRPHSHQKFTASAHHFGQPHPRDVTRATQNLTPTLYYPGCNDSSQTSHTISKTQTDIAGDITGNVTNHRQSQLLMTTLHTHYTRRYALWVRVTSWLSIAHRGLPCRARVTPLVVFGNVKQT